MYINLSAILKILSARTLTCLHDILELINDQGVTVE